MKMFSNMRVVIVMFSFLFGCSFFGHQPSPDEKLVNEITEKTALKLKDQKNLCLVGTGGQMMNDIQAMHMSFHFYHELDLNVARELVVYTINEYLSDINDNKEIRPYLHEYPFTAKNVEIRIWIYNPDRSRLPPDKIYYISATNGALDYYIRGSDEYSHQVIREETYEEALKLTHGK